MAEPKKQYEYGRTPEKTAPGVLGFFNLMSGPLVDMFTPSRREVIKPGKVEYEKLDDVVGDRYRRKVTPGVYGPEERSLGYMPVVQGARGIYSFLEKMYEDPAFRREVGESLVKGIGTLLDDQKRAALNMALGGSGRFYDPEQKRVISYDPLLVMGPGAIAGKLFPVKGPGAVVGMFAGRKSATGDKDKLEMAEEMAKKGKSREEIWKKTGWFRYQDRDGNPISDWRYEISDKEARAIQRPDLITPTGRLKIVGGKEVKPRVGDLFEHPAVLEAYPGQIRKANHPALEDWDDVIRKRNIIKQKLLELKKSNKTPEEYEIEYDLLQLADEAILTEFAQGKSHAATSTTLKSHSKDLEMDQPIIERALTDIPMGKEKDSRYGGTFSPWQDEITARYMPGQSHTKGPDYNPTYYKSYRSNEVREEIGNRLEKIKSKLRKEGFEVHGPSNRTIGTFPLYIPNPRTTIRPGEKNYYLSAAQFKEYALKNDRGAALENPQQLKNDLLEKHVPSIARPEDARPGLYNPDDLAKIRAERDAGGTGDASILFKDNPEAAKLFREYEDTWEAAKRLNTEDIDNMDEFFKEVQLHEIQHAIQSRERGQKYGQGYAARTDMENPGWEGGSNPSEFKGPYADVIKDPDTGKKLTPDEVYMRTLGEAEARLTQTRRNYGEALRDRIPPWKDLDVPEYKLLRRGIDFDK